MCFWIPRLDLGIDIGIFISHLEPKPKKMKPNPIEKKATSSSSWQEDPRTLTDLPEVQQSSVLEYRRHWHQIRTRFNRQNRLLDWYNYRLSSQQPQEVIQHLGEIFTDQSTVFKLNVSFGFILINNETGALQYYYASRNNDQVFEEPFQITTAADLPHEPTKPDGEEGDEDNTEEENTVPDIAAQLIHRSLCHYPSTLYLNLYQNHFSYIKDLKKYAKSYSCSRCGKHWKHVGMLNRHERTCEAKVTYQFPGGAYKTPPTIFQLLEDEGLTIPDHLKFFPYRATFDFECMFKPETDLNNTEKLTWNSKHIPLSVSVCSNVPEYDQPKCFVSDGDSKHLVKEMIDYLVEISQKSSDLMKQEFSFLFEAIDQKLEEIKQKSEQQSGESGTNVSVQEDSNDEGEDLMETDDEEEDIESETEEDRAFLDDEVESEQGASFYRALDRERENQSDDEEYVDDKPEANHPEPQKKKVHPLKKLRERFEEYLEELPLLGFNSGKYDLNAVKEFLFPVLVQNEEVQFTISCA